MGPGRGVGLDPTGWQLRDPLFLLSGLPKADPGHWWASFFFGKTTLPFMATVLESAEHSAESLQAPRSPINHDLAPEAMKKQPVNHPGQDNNRAPS